MLHREVQALRMEAAQLRGEIGSSGNPPQQAPPPPPSQASQPPPPASYGSDIYANTNRTELPPLRSIHNGPDSMTGVQYDAPRVNGYRQERY